MLCPGFVATGIYESERNRPANLGGSNASEFNMTNDGNRAEEEIAALQESLDAMLDPAIVGDMTLHAIQNNEFWIFTHPEFKDGFMERAGGIAAAFERWDSFRNDWTK